MARDRYIANILARVHIIVNSDISYNTYVGGAGDSGECIIKGYI